LLFKMAYNTSMNRIDDIKIRFEKLSPFLDENQIRLLAGTESLVFGHGGIAAVKKATGLSRNTIRRGKKDLENLKNCQGVRKKIRKAGGGRKKKLINTPKSEICSKI